MSDAIAIVAGLAALAAGVTIVLNSIRRPEIDAEAVLAELDLERLATDEFAQRLSQPLVVRVLQPLGKKVTGRIGSFLPRNHLDRLRHKFLLAGITGRIAPEEFMVLQAVAAGAGLLLGLAYGVLGGTGLGGGIKLGVILAVVVPFIPHAWLNRTRDARQGSIRRDLPDVLDLLAISVEAGVGFEGALEIVTRHFHSPLAAELSRTLREMELGLPRREALTNLKRRTEVSELSNFILILVQADALGMPIGRVLRTQAAEMRSKRRQWAREKAAKLPVKLLIPTVLLILPAIFIIVLGPAVPEIMKGL
ncbi:MAG: type II secretion system F family protein [Acidimicrobiia bacterium]